MGGRHHRFGPAAACVGIVLVFGCSGASGPEESGTTVREADTIMVVDRDDVQLLTLMGELNAYPAALYGGRLELDEAGCVRLAGLQTSVLWPAGTTVSASGSALEILDTEGSVAAVIGEAIELGGGEVPFLHEGLGFSPADNELAVDTCPGSFWLVAAGTVAGG